MSFLDFLSEFEKFYKHVLLQFLSHEQIEGYNEHSLFWFTMFLNICQYEILIDFDVLMTKQHFNVRFFFAIYKKKVFLSDWVPTCLVYLGKQNAAMAE